jgi:hypothetical protein
MGLKMKEYKIWKKFYECDCHTEGLMISYEYEEDGLPCIDIAFFQHGLDASKQLSFFERLRWCWHILKKGIPFRDMIILNQRTARELGEDLLKFSKKKYKFKK